MQGQRHLADGRPVAPLGYQKELGTTKEKGVGVVVVGGSRRLRGARQRPWAVGTQRGYFRPARSPAFLKAHTTGRPAQFL
jgi:hypothetical protein